MSMSTMQKLTVLTVAEDADAIVRRLMKLRCVEIRTTEVGDGALLSSHFDSDGQKAGAESRLRRIREAIPVLTKYTTRKKRLGRRLHRVDPERFYADGDAERAWTSVEKTNQYSARIKEIDTELARLQTRREALHPWLEYDVALSFAGSEQTGLVIGVLPVGILEGALLEELEALGAHAEIVTADKSGVYLSVLYHRADEEMINRLLAANGFLRTSFRDVDTTAAVESNEIDDQIDALQTERG